MALTLGIVGAGNMGAAIVRGAVGGGVLAPAEILIAEIDRQRRAAVADLGCGVSDDPAAVLGCTQIMLAVKPQSFVEVAAALGRLARRTVVISIMAGLRSATIRAALGPEAAIVRVMPNTPCQIGLGMSAIALGEGARRGDDGLAQGLFGAIGEVASVDEGQMYAVTAVSGSGPAYAFLLAEAMERAAIEMGIAEAVARQLVVQTIRGAGELMHRSGRPAAELREAVTSKGGTTAAALEVMWRQRLPEIVVEALAAARNRGRELDRA